MRPASEIHSSLELVESELARQTSEVAKHNLSIARDVLRWVVGGPWHELTDGENPWLVAFLLDDPPNINDTAPNAN